MKSLTLADNILGRYHVNSQAIPIHNPAHEDQCTVNKPPASRLTFPQLSPKRHFITVAFPRALPQAVRFTAHYSQAIV